MWRELVERVSSKHTFFPPASKLALMDIEVALGVALPPELSALLLESNGIEFRSIYGVLSAEQILARNLEMREFDEDQPGLYKPFGNLLFFADEGNGNLFFYPIETDGHIHHPDIFVWDHETDDRTQLANNLERFVELWYSRRYFSDERWQDSNTDDTTD